MDEDTVGRNDNDRAAVETIAGKPLPHTWPPDALAAGSRVRVVQDPSWAGPWAKVFTGAISDMGAPEPVTHRMAREGELKYWVDFDEPQMDGEGDGPYRKAQIWDRYLEAI